MLIIPRLEKEFSQWSEAAGGGAGGEGAETGDSDAALLSEQVTEAHIAEIVARATGIPAARLVAGARSQRAARGVARACAWSRGGGGVLQASGRSCCRWRRRSRGPSSGRTRRSPSCRTRCESRAPGCSLININ